MIKPKQIFECFIFFLSDFILSCFQFFVENAFLCFSSKTGSKVFSREAHDLELPAKKCLRKINFLTVYTETFATILRLYRDQKLLAKCSLAKIGFFQIQTEAIAIVSLLSRDLKLLAKVFVLQRSLSQLPCDCVATA